MPRHKKWHSPDVLISQTDWLLCLPDIIDALFSIQQSSKAEKPGEGHKQLFR
jgi:hypothetical protein